MDRDRLGMILLWLRLSMLSLSDFAFLLLSFPLSHFFLMSLPFPQVSFPKF